MGQLHINLLGKFEVGNGDAAAIALNPRARSLLAYLLLHRSAAQTRQHVAFVFFPDSTENQARANFRGLLRELRQALPDASQYIDSEGQTIQWRDCAPCVLDVAEFERAVAEAARAARGADSAQQRSRLEQAVALYGGELLPGAYEDWVLVAREHLQATLCDALAQLAGLYEAAGSLRAAIGCAERLRQQDDLRETTYRLLLRLHALNGDRAGVARVWEQCVARLRAVLEVEPSAETRRAFEKYRSFEPPAAPEPPPASAARPASGDAAAAASAKPPPPSGPPRPDQRLRYAKDALNYGLPVAGLGLSVGVLHAQLLVALPLSILVFLGLYFILNPRGAAEVALDDLRAEVLAKLDECWGALGRIRALGPAIRKPPVKDQVERIAMLADGIIRKYIDDPHTSLSNANNLEFFLALTAKIMDWYVRNGQGPADSQPPDVRAGVKQIESELLGVIETALQKLAAHADRSGLADLDVAISLLKSVLKMEGLSG